MAELSHIDEQGRARMVDVAEKPITRRICVARGEVRMAPETLQRISLGSMPKGRRATKAKSKRNVAVGTVKKSTATMS